MQILNQMADRMYPGKYQSDFAVQVTSQIPDAQQFSINFTNNNLLGSANFLSSYKTSKARVCVTVGMMTTGYDCPDILNLGLFRPIFSPTDFIQIKGRGTRKHDFLEQLFDDALKQGVTQPHKAAYKLFDFFANCEYFETEFNYDEVLHLPRVASPRSDDIVDGPTLVNGAYEHRGTDLIASVREETIGHEGMRIDRMFFEKFEDSVRENTIIANGVLRFGGTGVPARSIPVVPALWQLGSVHIIAPADTIRRKPAHQARALARSTGFRTRGPQQFERPG